MYWNVVVCTFETLIHVEAVPHSSKLRVYIRRLDLILLCFNCRYGTCAGCTSLLLQMAAHALAVTIGGCICTGVT